MASRVIGIPDLLAFNTLARDVSAIPTPKLFNKRQLKTAGLITSSSIFFLLVFTLPEQELRKPPDCSPQQNSQYQKSKQVQTKFL